jgi:hypothetical protein
MASLDSLPGDQRAVLQLVLGRGRGYGEIAGLLSIDPAAVRERALSALDALGPPTGVPDASRRLICDYLLGQLDESELPAVRRLLADAPAERAWARVLHSELAPLASGPMPEIPSDSGAAPPAASGDAPAPPAAAPDGPAEASEPAPSPPPGPRSSRSGGFVLIGVVVVVIAAAVVVLALHHSSGSNAGSAAASAPTSTAVSTNPASSAATATTSASGTGTARYVTQINLSPTSAGSQAAAIADVLQEGANRELAIVGQDVPANTAKNSYAVWLYNSQSSAVRLGFVSPGVSADGKLSAAGLLPSNAGQYKELVVTTETSAHPKAPGPILLEGRITGLS